MSDQWKKQDKDRRHKGGLDRVGRNRGGDVLAPVAVEGDAPHAWGAAGWI